MEATGKDWKPPTETKAATPKAKATTPPKELSGPAAEIDNAIKAQGDAVRKLKSEKADKSAVDEAVKKLLELKAKFKAETGSDWKPAEQSKENKGKENKKPAAAPPTDGEKSETQKKREAKKAEKEKSETQKKREESGGQAEAKDDGPDISAGMYGNQEMNQSKDKPGTVLTPVKDLCLKLNEKTVTIRGKGKQCFFVIRQQQVTVQCLAFVSDSISKQMIKFISHISNESIVDVEAVVKKVDEKIEGCTQQDVELHVKQVWVVSASDPKLPLQIEDAGT